MLNLYQNNISNGYKTYSATSTGDITTIFCRLREKYIVHNCRFDERSFNDDHSKTIDLFLRHSKSTSIYSVFHFAIDESSYLIKYDSIVPEVAIPVPDLKKTNKLLLLL